MAREKIGNLNLQAIKSARIQFEKVAAALLAAEVLLEQKKLDELWVFRISSLEKSLDRARAFNNELERSFHSLMSGKPLDDETKKVGRPKTAKGVKKK